MKKKVVKKNISKKSKVGPWLYWTPRVLSILFIIFIALFSLDIFGNGYSFWKTVLGLFMHNIITLILIGFLIFSWKREWIASIGFLIFGVWYILTILNNIIEYQFEWYYLSWFITIAGPAFVIAILWWLNWKRK